MPPLQLRPASLATIAILITSGPIRAQVLDEGPSDGSYRVQGAPVAAAQVGPKESGYEDGYQARVRTLVGGHAWPIGSGAGDPDVGKRDWLALLAEMWKVRADSQALAGFIAKQGQTLINSHDAGQFFKPFSVPGYTAYYFLFRDRLPDAQKAKALANLETVHANSGSVDGQPATFSETGWQQLSRPDHKMDPIYSFTEFNSENYDWMARLGGYLWAQALGDSARRAYYDGYLRDWVRALYHAGRVEWNSNNYWGYTYQPALVVYEFAADPAVKAMARAALDWMNVEAALHLLDGLTVGPDVRAKADGYKAFHGSVWPFAYAYFTDQAHPAFSEADAAAQMQVNMAGILPWSSYRPPQAIIELARRNYPKPVEIHSAKPFYALDFDNYADWKGDTQRGRRFEFETLYEEEDYILGSLASQRPDGAIGAFSEEGLWRLGVKGSGQGPVQVFGNAGARQDMSGRCPFEEMGQYREALLRLVKGADNIWVALPKSIRVDWDGDRAFADLGHGVYAAFQPLAAKGHASAPFSDTAFSRLTWSFDTAALGGLALEVGTAAQHGGYPQFQAAIKAKSSLASPEADAAEYRAASGRLLKVRFQPTTSYTMFDGTVIRPAGTLPEVWNDGRLLDYGHWQSLHAVSGAPIAEQNWGSGALTVQAGGQGLQIAVDPGTAQVQYREFAPSTAARPAVPAPSGRGGPRLLPGRDGWRWGRAPAGPGILHITRPDGVELARAAWEPGRGDPGLALGPGLYLWRWEGRDGAASGRIASP